VKKEDNEVGEKCGMHRKYRKKIRMLVGKNDEQRHIREWSKTGKVSVIRILRAKLCYGIHAVQDRGQAVGRWVMLMNTQNPANEWCVFSVQDGPTFMEIIIYISSPISTRTFKYLSILQPDTDLILFF
jgi:hypothetical protein